MNRNTQGLRDLSIIAAALTYAGAVIYGDVMFISVVSVAFPHGTILEALAYAGAIVTAVTALTLPIALHFWFAPGKQFLLGMAFWFVDIGVLALNSILAYQVSLGQVDSTMRNWQSLAPATPMLAVLGWGLMFLLDQSHILRHAQAEVQADLVETHAKQLKDAGKSAEVQDVMKAGAAASALDMASQLTGQPAATIKAQQVSTTNKTQSLPERIKAAVNGHGPTDPNP